MAIICRLLQVPAEDASKLKADVRLLGDTIKSARIYSDVYRYWHAIDYLLTQHSPDSRVAHWLELGTPMSGSTGEIPAARLIPGSDVADLSRLLQGIEPEDLIPHYDAAAMDAAAVYPATWQEWEETFDPLGQVLEHYSFLQSSVRSGAEAGHSFLLVFEDLPDGSV